MIAMNFNKKPKLDNLGKEIDKVAQSDDYVKM